MKKSWIVKGILVALIIVVAAVGYFFFGFHPISTLFAGGFLVLVVTLFGHGSSSRGVGRFLGGGGGE